MLLLSVRQSFKQPLLQFWRQLFEVVTRQDSLIVVVHTIDHLFKSIHDYRALHVRLVTTEFDLEKTKLVVYVVAIALDRLG